MKLKECMINTTDDWYPNYPDNQVLLSLSKLNTGNYRVSVWGQDDVGYDIDIKEITEACKLYQKLKERGNVSYEYLKTQGFNPF